MLESFGTYLVRTCKANFYQITTASILFLDVPIITLTRRGLLDLKAASHFTIFSRRQISHFHVRIILCARVHLAQQLTLYTCKANFYQITTASILFLEVPITTAR